jgi:thiamine kinase-like enzyme
LKTLERFGTTASVKQGCAKIVHRVTAPWIEAQPVIPQHGDLFVDNLLADRDRYSIVDWETFGQIDLPFYDLVTLLLSRLSANGEILDQWDSSITKRLPEFVQRYSGQLNLQVDDLRSLLPLTLANWFHLQWTDGRKAFTSRMYRTIQHYFDNVEVWERTFGLSAS